MAPSSLVSSMQRTSLETQLDDAPRLGSGNDFFTNLLDDIFLEIAGRWLELTSVLNLRRVCKRLNKFTHLRELWITLSLRLVVAEGIPWPQYALPLFDMPSSTLERLTVRALRMKHLWSTLPLDPTLVGGPFALIRYGRGQITWLRIVRTKWLIVGLKDCSMALWDIESLGDGPVAAYEGTKGFVMSGVTQSNTHGVALTVNTTQDQTYFFDMDLSFLGVQYYPEAIQQTNFVMKTTFSGHSKVLDEYEGLLGFSKSSSENIPVIFDVQRETSIHLLPGDGVSTLQSAVAIQVRPDVVIVAKDWNVELYSTAVIKADLKAPASDRAGYARPLKSFSHPYGCMMWRVGLPPRSNDALLYQPIVISGLSDRGWGRWTIQKQPKDDCIFTRNTSVWHDPQFVDNAIGTCCWGESGQRIAYIGESEAPVALCSFAYPPSEAEPNDIVRWVMPFNRKDFPWFCDIDEAAGVFVMGTACGRIWVYDPSCKTGRALEFWEVEAKD